MVEYTRLKPKCHDSIECYKPHLVDRGSFNSMVWMVWIMKKHFFSMAKITTICTVIVVTFVHQWHFLNMDDNFFFNYIIWKKFIWYLHHVFFINKGKRVNWRKSYIVWNKFHKINLKSFFIVIISLGFFSSGHDHTIFVRTTSHCYIFLFLFADDMLITSDNDGIDDFKLELAKIFNIKGLGTFKYFLGIEAFDKLYFYRF